MENILSVTAPIYLLMAVGFAAVRLGWMLPTDMRVMGQFVARFCVPALKQFLCRLPHRVPGHRPGGGGRARALHAGGGAIAAGVAFLALGLKLSGVPDRTVAMAAAAAPHCG